KFASCSCATLVVNTSKPAFSSKSIPDWASPSLAKILVINLSFLFQFAHNVHQNPNTFQRKGVVHGRTIAPNRPVPIDAADSGFLAHFVEGVLQGVVGDVESGIHDGAVFLGRKA